MKNFWIGMFQSVGLVLLASALNLTGAKIWEFWLGGFVIINSIVFEVNSHDPR